MITAQLRGRRLALAVETEPDEQAIPPVLVEPVSARVGRELSTRYLLAVEGLLDDPTVIGQDVVTAMGKDNAARIDAELSQHEAEIMLQAAYLWQTVGGMEAVRAYLETDEHGEQGGDVGRGKALAAFRLRAVPLLSQIRHSLESARRTREADTPATDTPPGGATSGDVLSTSPSNAPVESPPSTPTPASATASPSTPDPGSD